MSDLSGMSDEDRRTVLKARFDEMGLELLNSEAGRKWFLDRVQELEEAAKGRRTSSQSGEPQQPTRPQQQGQSQQHSTNRVSAFEKFLLGR